MCRRQDRHQGEEDRADEGQRPCGQEDSLPTSRRREQRRDQQGADQRAHAEEGMQQVQGGAALARYLRCHHRVAQRIRDTEADPRDRGEGYGEWPAAGKGRTGGGHPAAERTEQVAEELGAEDRARRGQVEVE